MVAQEVLVSLGLFVVQMIVAVYLIRYSNQQLMKSISGLRDKNLELIKLNARLTRTVMMNEDNFKKEIETIHRTHNKTDKTTIQASVKSK